MIASNIRETSVEFFMVASPLRKIVYELSNFDVVEVIDGFHVEYENLIYHEAIKNDRGEYVRTGQAFTSKELNDHIREMG